MKNVFNALFVFLIIIFSIDVHGQKTCCPKPSEIKELAVRTDFKVAHLAPIPINYSSGKGSIISFPVAGDKDGNAFYIPADEPTNRVLIVFHEWWGLNDYIKREAELWQNKLGRVEVYAIDLYDGHFANEPDSASALMSNVAPKRAEALIKSLLKKIGQSKKIATIGWCMGGTWSFTATVLADESAVGCVMYYGFPEKNLSKIKPLKADVLYIYGAKDKFIKSVDVDAFGKRITSLGYQFQFKAFDAVHAFANPSNPNYNKQAAAEANVIAFKFLQQRLGL